jgi:hypothetical protein
MKHIAALVGRIGSSRTASPGVFRAIWNRWIAGRTPAKPNARPLRCVPAVERGAAGAVSRGGSHGSRGVPRGHCPALEAAAALPRLWVTEPKVGGIELRHDVVR